MDRLSRTTGTAFPDRRTVAEDEGLETHTVENVLYDLRRWGHINWEMRADPRHKGRLLHYTLPVTSSSEEAIAAAILQLRAEREADGRSTRPNGYSTNNYPSLRVPVPAGTSSEESTRPDVGKSTRPDVCSNLYKGTGRESTPTPTAENGHGLHNGRGTTAVAGAPDEAELAVASYNDAAHAQGFTPCGKLTPQVRKRLDKRLREIGGLAEFKRALSVIHLDDFLAGRVRHQCDRPPFKLNLERLLRTDGGMGDVLAMLLGLADEAARSSGAGTAAQRDELADKLARMREEEDRVTWRQ
jgi:hypothetical protein